MWTKSDSSGFVTHFPASSRVGRHPVNVEKPVESV